MLLKVAQLPLPLYRRKTPNMTGTTVAFGGASIIFQSLLAPTAVQDILLTIVQRCNIQLTISRLDTSFHHRHLVMNSLSLTTSIANSDIRAGKRATAIAGYSGEDLTCPPKSQKVSLQPPTSIFPTATSKAERINHRIPVTCGWFIAQQNDCPLPATDTGQHKNRKGTLDMTHHLE